MFHADWSWWEHQSRSSLVKGQGYMGHFCDQLCEHFLLNTLKKLLIKMPEGTYPYLCTKSHSVYHCTFIIWTFNNRLPGLISHSYIKNPFRKKEGAYMLLYIYYYWVWYICICPLLYFYLCRWTMRIIDFKNFNNYFGHHLNALVAVCFISNANTCCSTKLFSLCGWQLQLINIYKKNCHSIKLNTRLYIQ